MFESIKNLVTKIKHERPLIINLTNNVTMDFIANGLLSLGASPIVSQSKHEMNDLLKIAQALVINLGTLDDQFVALCEHACHIANQLNIPIILDPVGAGATSYRTDACMKILEQFDIAIIRGNASEIAALSGRSSTTKGVDSSIQSEHMMEYAKQLSIRYDATVVMSGKTDIVTDGDATQYFNHGSSLMPMITGTGCLLSAVVAAFHAIEKNRMHACCSAVVFYGICGEIAAEQAQGPGSFKIHFLDSLNSIPKENRYAS